MSVLGLLLSALFSRHSTSVIHLARMEFKTVQMVYRFSRSALK